MYESDAWVYNKAQEVFKFSNLISKDYKIEDAVLYAEE